MMQRLSGKAAIVTGSGDGIGRHIALAFAREGAAVVVVDIKSEGVLETVRLIDTEVGPGHAVSLALDISTQENVQQIIQTCVERFGRLDCIVNNAANQDYAAFGDWTAERWDRVQNVNVRAVILFAQTAIPYLTAPPGGTIVNISSIRAMHSMPGGLAYDTSKAALLGLTRTLAVEVGLKGVRVNAICPGNIMSFGEERWRRGSSEREIHIRKAPYPLGRVGKPEEIAKVAVFLASDESSFITGQAIVVDGGMGIMNPETAAWRASEAG